MNHQRNKNLRRLAREKMVGNYPIVIGAFMVISIISMAASLIATYICGSITPLLSILFKANEDTVFIAASSILSFIVSFLLCIISVGSIKIYLTILSGQKPTIGMLFFGFSHHPDKILIANLPLSIISAVCLIPTSILSNMPIEKFMETSQTIILLSLLSIGASIIMVLVSLPLYLINYLLAGDTNLGAKEIIKTSIGMMKGNKWRLFCMLISFFGWLLLGVFSCGIGLLWIMPYMETSIGAFYLDLKETL